MKKITVPYNKGQRYYPIHYQYINDIFLSAGYELSFNDYEDLIVEINGKKIMFDYFDNINCLLGSEQLKNDRKSILEEVDKIFKFHYSPDINYGEEFNNKIISFTPISFYFRTQGYTIYKQYKGEGYITSRQIPYGNATKRRLRIQKILRDKYKAKTNIISQQEWWNEIDKIKIPVFVGGYSNNILDRGQLQYMAFACPTISTELPESIAFNQKLIPNTHYIKCKDDYSDLEEIINYLNINKAKEIGLNSRALFLETSTPSKLIEWITLNI